jgi:hypothetical protein
MLRPLLLTAVALIVAVNSPVSHADRGVGVNVGTIQVEDRLVRGGSYTLPVIGVTNTGDESGDYMVEVGYLEGQPGKAPPKGWLRFQPQRFFLSAGETKNVVVQLNLPTSAEPGDYFALIQAQPLVQGTGVTIGVVAATKLTFTVERSSWLDAQRVRINRFLDANQLWLIGAPLTLISAVIALKFKQLFRVRIERR